jgi:uncharacterized protein YdaU (DUF1376 family)
MSRAWMPLYVADYLADTGHLSAAEHGAYLLLIMHYWTNGQLPNEDRRLSRIARMSPAEWEESRETLFDLFDDGWTHKRIDAELEAAREISEKAKEKANKRWHNPGNAKADATAMPQHMPEPCQSQSQPPTTPDTNVSGVVRAKARPEHAQILEILTSVIPEAQAKAVMDHRRKKKSPLNPHSAGLLVKQFQQLAEPEKGADLMMTRGWTGCDPEWCANAGLKLASSPSPVSGPGSSRTFVKRDSDAWWAWRDHRKAQGKPMPTAVTSKEHAADGWWFDTELPPVQAPAGRAA